MILRYSAPTPEDKQIAVEEIWTRWPLLVLLIINIWDQLL
jgi:hypothetical protein